MAALLNPQIEHHLETIYEGTDVAHLASLANDLIRLMRLDNLAPIKNRYINHWDQEDTVLICYGDSVLQSDQKPLITLKLFLDTYSKGVIDGVHILPFYPFTSDDGFSVLDYSSVNPSLGEWEDIVAIANDYSLMADLVINHCSA